MESIDPLEPAAPYIGGKKQLAGRIAEIIAGIPHDTYVEPFIGMGGVFFRRSLRPSAEIINDKSGDVANFFRILQRHYIPFVEMMRFQITTRREFARLSDTPPETLTDLERAARFLYLQSVGFGGKVAGRSFGVSLGRPGRFDVTRIVPKLERLHERLAAVTIENLDYSELIARYDSEATLFYLDPPYFGSERDYGKGLFDRADFKALADILAGTKGRFILSINDRPEIRALFAWATIEPVDVTYTVARDAAADRFAELIISNGTLDALPADGLFGVPD